MLFPGFPGIATAAGLFALIWLVIYLKSRGTPVVFDPGGKHGEFGKRLLPMYLDITKFVLGLAAGSIVLLVGSLNFNRVWLLWNDGPFDGIKPSLIPIDVELPVAIKVS